MMEERLSRDEIVYLLELEDRETREEVFAAARRLRFRYFGPKIFLYGFIYFSTWCRNHCTFCNYRAPNVLCQRYRKTEGEIIEAAVHLAESGVQLIDLTMGEDPFYFQEASCFDSLLNLVQDVKNETGLPIMISWGVVPEEILEKLPEVGADWFACYQETHNPQLFRRLRIGQDYSHRFEMKYEALQRGILVEEGILSGVGETLGDVANSIWTMRAMEVQQVRVMNFVPQMGTPMEQTVPPSPNRERMIIAVMRIVMPQRLIPASLDVDGINGLRGKLEAGANVVTSLIPPRSDLMGVARSTLEIVEGQRAATAVLPIIDALGMRKATLEDYLLWINKAKRNLCRNTLSASDRDVESSHCWWEATGG